MDFNALQYLLKHISCKLEHLAIEMFTEDVTCLDAQQWEIYLKTNLTALNHFDFFVFLRNDISDKSKQLRLKDILKTFQTEYWSSITPQKIIGYYHPTYLGKSICIHTEIVPSVKRRRYFLC